MHSLHPAPVQHTLESNQAERAGGPLHPSQPCHTPFSLGLGQLVYRTRLGGCCEGSTPFDCPLSKPVDRNKLRMMLKKNVPIERNYSWTIWLTLLNAIIGITSVKPHFPHEEFETQRN